MALLACRFGPRVVLPTVATFEQVDQSDYDDQPETEGTGLRDRESSGSWRPDLPSDWAA